MRYSVARSRPSASMAPTDPKAPASKPVAAPAKPAVAEAEPVLEYEVERVNMAGLVLEKTSYPDGTCETEVVSEPAIDPALVRATRASQRSRGH